jgi:hypothetical protein
MTTRAHPVDFWDLEPLFQPEEFRVCFSHQTPYLVSMWDLVIDFHAPIETRRYTGFVDPKTTVMDFFLSPPGWKSPVLLAQPGQEFSFYKAGAQGKKGRWMKTKPTDTLGDLLKRCGLEEGDVLHMGYPGTNRRFRSLFGVV